MHTKLYRLVPQSAESTNWAGKTNHGIVVVRALSESDAREIAANAEIACCGTTASVFTDPALYAVREERLCNYSLTGLRMVLSGSFAGLGWALHKAKAAQVGVTTALAS
jgi:hypothetical protein